MFENIIKFFKKISKKDKNVTSNSKDTAKERLHLVLMQDRANVSVDFLELMKQEIIDVIKKYIDVDEAAIDVRLTNKENEDGTNGAPALYANIPILNIKNETRKVNVKEENQDTEKKEDKKEEKTVAENKEKENKTEEVKTEEKKGKEENKDDRTNELSEKNKDNLEKENTENESSKNQEENIKN